MTTAACDYDPLYLQGVAYFNACEFFEAHEVWEELWKNYSGDLRLFYKGLIQAAVALHHFGNGNIRGARKVYRSSRGYLTTYRPVCVGLDLEDFLTKFDACFAEVDACQEEFPRIEIDPELIPEIALDPPVDLPPVVIED
jgi:uncharacterized protein